MIPQQRGSMFGSAIIKILLLAVAALVLRWGLADPIFRNGEGSLVSTVCLAIGLAASLTVIAATWNSPWKNTGQWIALALFGQAVALQLVMAGPTVSYQHYHVPQGQFTGLAVFLLGWLVAQTALVATGVSRRWSQIRNWAGRSFQPWQHLVIGLLFTLSSATLSRSIFAYGGEILFATFIQALALGTIVLAVWAIPEHALAPHPSGLIERCGLIAAPQSEHRSIDRFSILAATWVFVLSLTLALVSYERHAHVPDEVGYLIQAGYFAKGMLWLPLPPIQGAFGIEMLYFGTDKVYSIFPPGWPAALALGVLIGAPWIVNPLLAALNVLMTYLLLQELYDRRIARLGVVLLVCSPWSIFLAMSYMAHTFTLTCALVAALGIVAARRSGRAVWAWLAGGAIGVSSLVRPLDALVIAGLMGLWSVGLGGKRLSFRAIFGMITVAITIGIANLPYNRLLTGKATTFPVMQYFATYYGPNTNALGFGPERGVGWTGVDPFPGHGLTDVLVNANLNFFATNIELFGWSCGSLLLIFLAVFSRRMQRSDRLLVASGLAIIGIHTFYWFSGGPDFGARYWFLILIPCIGLTARGTMILGDLLGTQSSQHRVTLGVVSLCLLAMVTFVPWRAIDKYHHYRGMRAEIRSLAREAGFGRSLVLIQGEHWPDYHSAAVYNPPKWDADQPVYAWDQNPEVRDSLLRLYPDRPIWIVAGPSMTRGPFRLLRGPVPASDLR